MSTRLSAPGQPGEPGPPSPWRLAVVVAHPDDETFDCGSLLLHAAATGAETTVVCATRGEAGEATPGTAIGPQGLADVRERELARAAALLGVTRVELLGFRDSGMSGPPDPSSLVGVDAATVRDAVLGALDEAAPDVVVTLDASDGHRDHERIRDATLAAVEMSDRPPAHVYLHGLPRSLMRRWVAERSARDPTDEPTWEHLRLADLGTPDERITTVLDTGQHLERRLVAMWEHRSQRSPFDGLSPELTEAFLTREHLVRVRPAWTGGPIERTLAAREPSAQTARTSRR